MKRKSNRSSYSKKVRVKVVEDPADTVLDESGSAAVAGPSSIEVENITFTPAASGHRYGQSTERRTIVPNPAEHVLRPHADLETVDLDDLDPTSSLDSERVHDFFEGSESGTHPAQEPETPLKKTRARPDLRAANKLREWLPFREEFLEELLCYAEEWDGKRFMRTSLRALGLEVQLGHLPGKECLQPGSNARRIVVCHLSGVHEIQVNFCKCLDDTGHESPEWAQLFRVGWFPATTAVPATAFTFDLLKTFQELNFQAKTNLNDFWSTIERLTDNSGGSDVPNRYKQLSHVMRLWRHLTLLKRFGRAHDNTGAAGTSQGELVVECPACPHPEKNLPENWENAAPSLKWLYTLFLMMDANFRARCKDRGFDDIELAPGWAYYVEEKTYQAHILSRANEKEVENTCSAEHNAIRQANLHKEGYIASGIGAVLCARHALVRKNGAGDLQQGERQANMDYLYFSTLLGVVLVILISYDIVCQWARHLFKRMFEWFPSEMHVTQTQLEEMRFAIPKKHFRVHGGSPHSQYSFNYLPRVGRTYGERIETHWSHMNPLALSTREMSIGMRHDVLNDNWGAWNWQKTLEFGYFLLRSLEEAHEMRIKQRRIFREYNATFAPEVVERWEKMVQEWNRDHSQPDPYEEPSTGITMAAVKLELAQQEAIEAHLGQLPPHEVTPAVFLQVALELEEQQRTLRLRAPTGTSISELADQQTKRNVLSRRIELWQAIQDVHMPTVSPLRSEHASRSAAPIKPEDVQLWLPSALPPTYRSVESLSGLQDKERRLHLAQMSDSLEDIRRIRRVLAAISEFKRLNVSGTGQRAVTRTLGVYNRFLVKERRCTERYRAARTAMVALDPTGKWVETYKVLLDGDLRGPRRDDDEVVSSEGCYEISWIWLTPRSALEPGETSSGATAEEFTETMRAEWARSKARAERWEEEEQLLLEEMRRVLTFFEWKSRWWQSQGKAREDVSPRFRRGLAVYAAKQAAVYERLAARTASYWINYLKALGPLPSWIQPYQAFARKVRPRWTVLTTNDVEQDGESSDEEL
ncbi:hypothetical protein GSI_09412 [Ganoderma sinense ZZ0214-1]|uniref:CxC2-like cysteine cluster KDZ transposase-associated domain-containing protein n=1 Tax=Ganoderma sinense ZZ0214-1 TaxID=1077348 RepID=A0A2G8S6H4_9APHY|nr:hypothetical protein GSI_09412 [Ganoderma sinense ZZ0214-1]